MKWLRGLLPGVFVEACHWRERAENAEARLHQVLEQYHTLLTHEREVHATERAELLKLLLTTGITTQKPPQSAIDNGEDALLPSSPFVFQQYTNPIQRIQAEAREQLAKLHANLIPDDEVDTLRDEYLKQSAVM